MSRRIRLSLLIAGSLLTLLLALLLGLWLALQYEPEFYRRALAVAPAAQEKASDEMLQHTAALASDLSKPGNWQAHFTARQINGWLTVDMQKNHPQTLPPFLRDPRVCIEPGRIVLACRYRQGFLSTVFTLTVEPSMPEENVLALRVVSARAGLLPMPLGKVLAAITEAARQSEWRLRWRQAGGAPVALLSPAAPEKAGDLWVKIQNLRLGQDEIFVSGVCKRQE
jgi:hypothetical protein